MPKHSTPPKYARVIADWIDRSGEPQCRKNLNVEQLALAYLDHAKRYYVKNGDGTDHVHKVRAGLKLLIQFHRGEAVTEFSPRILKGLQQTLITRGRSRSYINDLIGVIKRCFKWGASEELVPVRIHDALRTVDGLRKGRSAARETEPVRPVAEADVLGVLTHVSKQIKAMIELQQLTGMRPGEVLVMRPGDVTMRTDGLWTYRPQSHKKEHHGRERVVFLGRKAQVILRPWLDRESEAYCFQPAESDRAHEGRQAVPS